eukprot:1584203-Prorocentrum_lima.AAC.1
MSSLPVVVGVDANVQLPFLGNPEDLQPDADDVDPHTAFPTSHLCPLAAASSTRSQRLAWRWRAAGL